MAKDLPLKLAQDYLKRSLELARVQDMRIAVAVVDRGGHVVASARMDGVGQINLDVATRKARAGMSFASPTHAMLEFTASDPLISMAFEAMDDHLLVLPGGFPVTLVADVVGGFGIAGGHYSQDRAIGEQVISQIALEAAE
jgi:glc operon protein GlcG